MRQAICSVGVALSLVVAPSIASERAPEGSVVPFVFITQGEQETPPVTTAATGGCYAVLDEPAAQVNITCVHNVAEPTAAHVHAGAVGVAGPVVFNLGDPTSPITGSWTGLSEDDVTDLLAGLFYINIHSTPFPGGELRGQIVERTIDDFGFGVDASQSVPPTASAASGFCTGDLSEDAIMLTLVCTHDVSDPTAAHVHQGAVGETGPVLFNFGDPSSPMTLMTPLLPTDLAELAGELLYVNIHSAAFPAGEIRGQVVNEQIFADGFESGDVTAWSRAVE